MEKKAQSFEDIHKECKKAYYSLVKRHDPNYKFGGRILSQHELLVGCNNVDQSLTWEEFEWNQKYRDLPLFDQFLTCALRIGIQQGFDWAHDIAVNDPLEQFRKNWSADELANFIKRLETIRMLKS